MPVSRRNGDSGPEDPWGFGTPEGIQVGLPDAVAPPVDQAAPKATLEQPVAEPEVPREASPAPRSSEAPWTSPAPPAHPPHAPALPPHAPAPRALIAPRSLPPPPRVITPSRLATGTLNPDPEVNAMVPVGARDHVGDTTLYPEPGGSDSGHRVQPGRGSSRRVFGALAVAAVLLSGIAGYLWFSGAATGRDAVTSDQLGTFVLSSHPPGAQVVVDGAPVGTTPLAIRLSPGEHSIVATGANGRAEQLSTTVVAGEALSRHLMFEGQPPAGAAGAGSPSPAAPVAAPSQTPAPAAAAVVAPPPPGFVSFAAPFDLQIFEDGDYLANSGDRIRVRPGTHTFTLVNEELGFRSEETVVVAPGRSTRRVVEQPTASLSVNATPWAEVLIAGRSFGQTPLANIALPLGTHQVTLRHPTLGERQAGVTVRLGRPNRLAVDLRK